MVTVNVSNQCNINVPAGQFTQNDNPYCPNTPRLAKPQNNLQVLVKPNPTVNYWVVDINVPNKNLVSYSLCSIDGKIIFKESNIGQNNYELKIDASNLNSGLYILKVNNQGEIQTHKLLKN